MKNLVLILLVIISFSVYSCSKLVYFTQDVRANLDDNKLEIGKVQFYNSDKIVIKRNLSKEETQIAKGSIVFENGEYFEEIVIPKKTKGVVVDSGTGFLKVAFENGDDRNLRFDLNEDYTYQISADRWIDDYGYIKYDTSNYFLMPYSSNTLLMVNKEFVSNFEMKRRVIQGRSVER